MAFHSGKPRKGAHLIKTDKKKAEKTAAALPKKRRIPAALLVILVLIVLLAGGALGTAYFYPNIFPGVTVGSIDVGGLSRDEAAQQIATKSKPLYQGKKLTLTIYDADYDIPVENVLSGVDDIQSAENAWKVGREGGPLARMTAIISAMRNGCDTRLDASVDESGLKAQLEEIAAEALTEPVAPTWKLDGENLVIQSGTPGVQFDTAAVEQALTAQIELMDFKPYEVSTNVTAAPAIDIDKIAEDVTGSPVNATVSKKDGKTIIPGKSGVQFDVEKAKEIIGDGSQASYSIPVTITQPTITEAVLRERLFRDTLARTATNLNEGNAPRTNNVRLAAKAINGTILNPGDVFSYNTVVGERTQARGYQEAHAYSGGKIIDEFGGGVCQPSSTLYMAVLRADLEVVERHNHSFTVSYTPLGEDATVDYGNLDFRFANNTAYDHDHYRHQNERQDGRNTYRGAGNLQAGNGRKAGQLACSRRNAGRDLGHHRLLDTHL